MGGAPPARAWVPVNGDTIRAGDSGGRTIATAVTTPPGRFQFVLAPGTYRITEDICGVSRQVTVPHRAAARVKLTIPNAC